MHIVCMWACIQFLSPVHKATTYSVKPQVHIDWQDGVRQLALVHVLSPFNDCMLTTACSPQELDGTGTHLPFHSIAHRSKQNSLSLLDYQQRAITANVSLLKQTVNNWIILGGRKSSLHISAFLCTLYKHFSSRRHSVRQHFLVPSSFNNTK